jgi:hypothetical protein
MKWLPLALALTGCAATPRIGFSPSTYVEGIKQTPGEPLAVLSWTAGLSILAGMALLVITGGRKGKWPVLGGVGLVLISFLVSRYHTVIFYPLVACTGVISIVWTWKIVRQILKERKL